MKKEQIIKLGKEIFLLLNEEEGQKVADDFMYIEEQVKFLGKLENIDQEEPLIFPFPQKGVLSEDVSEDTYKPEVLFSNSKNVEDEFIVLPKVVK